MVLDASSRGDRDQDRVLIFPGFSGIITYENVPSQYLNDAPPSHRPTLVACDIRPTAARSPPDARLY